MFGRRIALHTIPPLQIPLALNVTQRAKRIRYDTQSAARDLSGVSGSYFRKLATYPIQA